MAKNSPGWYPDPNGNRRLLWWDGTAWFTHTSSSRPLARNSTPSAAARQQLKKKAVKRVKDWLKTDFLDMLEELQQSLAASRTVGMPHEKIRGVGKNSNVNFPGVYVYSYPSYLAQPDAQGRIRLKVGMSMKSVSERFHGQKRKTSMAEDIVLLRAMPAANPYLVERYLHQKLAHQRITSSTGGREWFWASLEEMDLLLSQASNDEPIYSGH